MEPKERACAKELKDLMDVSHTFYNDFLKGNNLNF